MLAQMLDQRSFLYLAKHFPTSRAHRDSLEIRNKKEKKIRKARKKTEGEKYAAVSHKAYSLGDTPFAR